MQAHFKFKKPHPGQKKVIESKAKYKVLLCGRQWGKTLVSQIIALNKMIEGKDVAYLTPEYDLANTFYEEILAQIPENMVKRSNVSKLLIEMRTGGSIKFFSGEAIQKMRGRRYSLVIFDEAALIPDLENVWQAVVKPLIGITRGEALFVSTPRGMDFFYALYDKGVKGVDGFESFHYPTHTNPYYPKEMIEEFRLTTPEAQFNEEYMAEPQANQSNPFGKHIDDNVVTEFSTKPTVVYAVDTATVKDWTVCVGLDEDGNITYFDRFRMDWTPTHNRLLLLDKKVPMYVDTTNNESFQITLALERPNTFGFKFTSVSKPMIMFKLINAVQKGEITYNEITAKEMKTFEMHKQTSGHVKFGAISGFHDDCVCALAMANHFRLQALAGMNWSLHFL